MTMKTRLRSVQKSLVGRQIALFWLKLSQEYGGYLDYWKHADFQQWPSESQEGGLLYFLVFEVNGSVMLAADTWRQIASWAGLLGISIIGASDAENTGRFEAFPALPERWREKLSRFLAEVLAHEEAVDLISEGYFQGNDVLFADTRAMLTASRECARELIVGYNWFAALNNKEQIDEEGNNVLLPHRTEQLVNQWVKLSRGKALAANGKIFEGRDEIISFLQPEK